VWKKLGGETERGRTKEREKKKRKSKTVTIKLQKSRDGSDCSFEIWKFNLVLISVLLGLN
jgi:hypothetical protein